MANKAEENKQAGWNANTSTEETKPAENNQETKPDETLTLEFDKSGWCEELKESYRKGVFLATSKKQYDALKKYAKKK